MSTKKNVAFNSAEFVSTWIIKSSVDVFRSAVHEGDHSRDDAGDLRCGLLLFHLSVDLSGLQHVFSHHWIQAQVSK